MTIEVDGLEGLEVIEALGLSVGLDGGVPQPVWWTFAELAAEAVKDAPVLAFVPPGSRLSKVPPLKKAKWCLEEADKELWLAEELLTKLRFYSYTPEEQKLLARLFVEYQTLSFKGLAHAVYWLRAAGWSDSRIKDRLRMHTRDGIESICGSRKPEVIQ